MGGELVGSGLGPGGRGGDLGLHAGLAIRLRDRLRLAALQPHHRPAQGLAHEQVGLGIAVVVVVLGSRRFDELAPEVAGVHRGNRAGELRMLLRIAHGHLRLPHAVPWAGREPVAVKADRGDDGRHLRRGELLAEILDQVHQMPFVLFLGGVAILVALEPGEAGDLVALSPVARHDLGDPGKRVPHALHHQPVFEPLPLVGARLPRRAARRRPEVPGERAVAHRRLDEQHRLIVERAHHEPEADLRSDRVAPMSEHAQGRALAPLGDPGFLERDVVADRPRSLLVEQVGKLSFLLHERDEVAPAGDVDLLHPQGRGARLEEGDGQRMPLSGLEDQLRDDGLAARFAAVDLLAVDRRHRVGAVTEAGVQRVGARGRDVEPGPRHRRVRAVDRGQPRRDRSQRHPRGLHRLERGVVGPRVERPRVEAHDRPNRGVGRGRFVDAVCRHGRNALPVAFRVPLGPDGHHARDDRGVGREIDAGVERLRARDVAHADHVGLAGEDVDLHRLGRIARRGVGPGEVERDHGVGRGDGEEPGAADASDDGHGVDDSGLGGLIRRHAV